MTKRCSRCGKKIRVLRDGTIASHDTRIMASRTRHMSRPDLDDFVLTVHCPGSYEKPHRGRWKGEIGFYR